MKKIIIWDVYQTYYFNLLLSSQDKKKFVLISFSYYKNYKKVLK